jgi:hypothetical protein
LPCLGAGGSDPESEPEEDNEMLQFYFKFDFTIADVLLILIILDLVAIFIKHQIGWPNVLNFPPIKMDVLKGSEPSINKYIKK